MAFIGTWVVTAVAVACAAWLTPGIYVVPEGSYAAVIIAALMLALVNMVVRPVVRALSLPITVITLGIFHFVVNALMLLLASWLSINLFGAGIAISSFGAAFWGALVISLVCTVIEAVTGLGSE